MATAKAPVGRCERCGRFGPTVTFHPAPFPAGWYDPECARIVALPNDPRVVAAYHKRAAKRKADDIVFQVE